MNLDPPILQPDLPNYPLVEQLARVASDSIGSNIYPGYVQQYAGALAFRDREACYIWEPNGVQLSPAIYDCRLIGSYQDLPLYAATCCISAPFGSSASSVGN